MNFLQNALKDFKTTLAGLLPLGIGGYLIYRGVKSGNLDQILQGSAYFGAGAVGVAAKDSVKQ